MKVKSLALLITAGLFASTASAASVVLYGGLDAAVLGVHTQQKVAVSGADAQIVGFVSAGAGKAAAGQMKWNLANGLYSGSILGFKGMANITENSIAGFQLELGYDVINGSLKKPETLFNRGAFVYAQGPFGRLALGYMPSYLTNFGLNNVFARTANPFIGSKAGGNAGFLLSSGPVVNNAVAYQSPKIAGFQLGAFFSPDVKNSGKKFKQNVRMGQVALSFVGGPVQLVVLGSRTYTPWGVTVPAAENSKINTVLNNFKFTPEQKHDDAVIKAAANVALGEHVKVFVGGSKTWKGAFNMNGWDANVGTSLNFGGNTLGLNVMYGKQTKDFKLDGLKLLGLDVATLGVQARYDYAFTQYAHVYLGAEYKQVENKLSSTDDDKTELKVTDKTTRAFLGMSYKF